MIADDEELAITVRQLSLVEEIVDSWRKKLLPHHPENFALYAEGAIEQAEILTAEIDEYLARKQAKVPDANAFLPASEQQPTPLA